jgi:hypothetical protein
VDAPPTLRSVTVKTKGSWMRGPGVAALMGDGRAEVPRHLPVEPDSAGVPLCP